MIEPELPAKDFGILPANAGNAPAADEPATAGGTVLLLDNGSLAPSATLGLRLLAGRLAQAIGETVEPVSLLHADGIPAAELAGVPAEIFGPALERRLAQGQNRFVVIPLFLGPSQALDRFLPGRVASLTRRYPALRVVVAPPLYAAGDDRLARILQDRVLAVRPAPARVIVVDHGSPVPAVTAVRDALGRQLQALLGGGTRVGVASMERRPGAEYDFNEPLLETLLDQPEWRSGDIVVARQFLLPGRHAGPGGDIERICLEAERRNPGLRLHLTAPLAGHPLLESILAERCLAYRPRS